MYVTFKKYIFRYNIFILFDAFGVFHSISFIYWIIYLFVFHYGSFGPPYKKAWVIITMYKQHFAVVALQEGARSNYFIYFTVEQFNLAVPNLTARLLWKFTSQIGGVVRW